MPVLHRGLHADVFTASGNWGVVLGRVLSNLIKISDWRQHLRVTEDGVVLASWLTTCHLPGLSLTSSPVATCLAPFRQTAMWDKMTFLTFTHVGKECDNTHNWLRARTVRGRTPRSSPRTHRRSSSNIRKRQGRKSDRLTTRIQIAILRRWSMQQIVSTNSSLAKVTTSQGPHHNALLCLISR